MLCLTFKDYITFEGLLEFSTFVYILEQIKCMYKTLITNAVTYVHISEMVHFPLSLCQGQYIQILSNIAITNTVTQRKVFLVNQISNCLFG